MLPPRSAREVVVAVTQESTIGAKRLTLKSASTISRANIAPASGAWNDAAMPAPAPHASSTAASRRGKARKRLREAATAPPRWTTGPSFPALPPEPMTRPAANDFHTAMRPRNSRPRRWIASITSTTPWPPLSGLTYRTSRPAARAPNPGASTRTQTGDCTAMTYRPPEVSWNVPLKVVSRTSG